MGDSLCTREDQAHGASEAAIPGWGGEGTDRGETTRPPWRPGWSAGDSRALCRAQTQGGTEGGDGGRAEEEQTRLLEGRGRQAMNHSSSLEANSYVNLTGAACCGLTVKPEISTHGLPEHSRQPSAGEWLFAKPLLRLSDPARAGMERGPPIRRLFMGFCCQHPPRRASLQYPMGNGLTHACRRQ